ncbi:Prenyltransferase and squalene oxidase repeat protein [Poriferisphaera corsica]|uniref:Prenyltransferase and squalene oxidase repeat protein n=2 Tax=Poriferisphaera corsica TaxID=2528020 RepID=A0A517YT62_9BACT|nr:Prenyltransferase and squalene oxidase repeat protein [Poriferisphaera corsica]
MINLKRLGLQMMAGVLGIVVMAGSVMGADAEHVEKGEAAIAKGVAFLKGTQNADGSWTPQPGPGITAMAMQVMIDDPHVGLDDPSVLKALGYVLSKAQPNGSIADGDFLTNYNTSICLSALSRLKGDPKIDAVMKRAQDYLKSIQWAGQLDPNGKVIDKDHPYYGGAGYGKHGRPDMSNTQFMLQALHDSGLSSDDEAFQRALVFISRHQGVESNEMFKNGELALEGGFVYAVSLNKDNIGVPQSKASPEMEDEAKAGRPVSGLRAYGSMTYAGFKSLLYAGLTKNDPRVVAAYNWMRENYTFEQNPGMPEKVKLQGLFYYYMAAARALRVWGQEELVTPEGAKNWGNDLIDQLVSVQAADGSWINSADRWMEDDANLVTAYSLMSLQNATYPRSGGAGQE